MQAEGVEDAEERGEGRGFLDRGRRGRGGWWGGVDGEVGAEVDEGGGEGKGDGAGGGEEVEGRGEEGVFGGRGGLVA